MRFIYLRVCFLFDTNILLLTNRYIPVSRSKSVEGGVARAKQKGTFEVKLKRSAVARKKTFKH